ncbi:B-cell lymphoma 6 [Portunus trituberculatus]|uniref:B-cell lymphoma 6 n=1 Tax=Portunus trituberculatus TaxID=210409 RepID=A0A5B7FF29_PORTR|nr:B-cell lymphoma 6 [Portunus trituberculatus]
MYGHYGPLTPTTPPTTTTTTLKLAHSGPKEGALTSVTLAGSNALVPTTALVDTPALSSSLSCGSGEDETNELVGETLAVATERLKVAGGRHVSPVDVGGIDTAALVTSMVAPGECQGGGRKVIVKLFNSNTFSLDIIAGGQEEEEERIGHHMLARNGTLVHTKLSEGTLISTQEQVEGENNDEDLASTAAHAPHQGSGEEEEGTLPCQVMWTCAYCSLILGTSEAMASHQQVCAKALEDLPPLETTTSQTTVDALMSPLQPQEEATYHLKIEGTGDGPQTSTREEGATTGSAELVAVWMCAVCKEEFPHPRALGHHLPSHTIHQLATALLQLATPCQKVMATVAAADNHTTASAAETDPLSIDENSDWANDQSTTKLEEENVDNPGDTPPQTPPQDKPLARRAQRKHGARLQERAERKRKYLRKKKGEEEEVAGKETEIKGQCKEYQLATATTTIVSTTITNTQPAPSGSVGTGRGSRDPHHCEVCNKKLSSRGNLAKHLIRHRAKKPFECNICHATFNANRDCKNHYLQHHTTERPNRCQICGKSYVDKSYLLAHMVFHRDQKAYSCELCGKKFNTSRCVTRHKKRHQEEKRFVCDICFRPFAVKADLTSHKRKVHSKLGTVRSQSLQQQQHQQHSLLSTQQGQLPHSTQAPPPQPPPPPPPLPPRQDQEAQVGKSKDLTEFLLPGEVTSSHMLSEQLLPPDLSGEAGLQDSVTQKRGGIFISGDPLAVSSLIGGGEGEGEGDGECSYGVTLTAPTRDGGASGGAVPVGGVQPAYIMINSSSSSTEKGVATTTSGLSIMYTNAATLTQQVCVCIFVTYGRRAEFILFRV